MPDLPAIPRDAGGPVFAAPWQAQAFATVLQLHEAGVFTWAEWAEALGAEIKAAQAGGDPDRGDTYYQHWLAALEALVQSKQLVTFSELVASQSQAAAAAAHHDHIARREPVAIA